MQTKKTSPTRAGIAGCTLLFIGSILLSAAVHLFAPMLPGLPYGDILQILSYVGSLGAITVGVLVYHWVKNRQEG